MKRLAIPQRWLDLTQHQALLGAVLVLGYAVLHHLVFRWCRQPESVYHDAWLLPAALRDPRLLFLCVATLGWLALFARRIAWSRLEGGKVLRGFILAACIASAWTFSLYETNAYYDQSHTLMRVLMLSSALLVLLHPAFAFAYVLLGTLLVSQLHAPIPGFNWLDKQILFDVLILFGVFLAVRAVRAVSTATFVTVLLALIAADYVVPGIAKLRLSGWATEDNLANLAFATWHNGWMWWLDESAMLKLLDAGAWTNRPLIVATLIGELGFLFLLVHRWAFRLLILFSFGLHAGIYLSSGILFWKWMLLNVLVIVLVERLGAPIRAQLFRWRNQLGMAAAVLAFPLTVGAPWLAWFDTPLSEVFHLRAIGVSGQSYAVPRLFMAPYELIFAQNRFFYLLEEPHLVGTFGATSDRTLHARLLHARTAADVDALVPEYGRTDFDVKLAAGFDAFLAKYFGTLNRRGVKHAWYSKFQAPYHIWSRPRERPLYDMQEPVRSIEVVYERALYTGDAVVPLGTRVIRTIPIPNGAP